MTRPTQRHATRLPTVLIAIGATLPLAASAESGGAENSTFETGTAESGTSTAQARTAQDPESPPTTARVEESQRGASHVGHRS